MSDYRGGAAGFAATEDDTHINNENLTLVVVSSVKTANVVRHFVKINIASLTISWAGRHSFTCVTIFPMMYCFCSIGIYCHINLGILVSSHLLQNLRNFKDVVTPQKDSRNIMILNSYKLYFNRCPDW